MNEKHDFWDQAFPWIFLGLSFFLFVGGAHAATESRRPGSVPEMSPSACVYVHFSQGSLTDKRSVGDREDRLIEECKISSKQASCLFDEHPKEEVGSISDLIEACKI